jgi:hypothetical protein
MIFGKTYEGIIKGFTKTIKDLRALAEKNAVKIEVRTNTIKDLKAECISLEKEGSKAVMTAEKLESLLG